LVRRIRNYQEYSSCGISRPILSDKDHHRVKSGRSANPPTEIPDDTPEEGAMRIRNARRFVGQAFIFVSLVSSGCRSAINSRPADELGSPHSPHSSALMGRIESTSDTFQAFQSELVAHRRSSDDDNAFVGQSELDINQLVAEVLKRNPSIPAMVATWQAAAARYPQVISLDDPMFGFMVGPASIGSNDVDFGWMVEASQKIPWAGKRRRIAELERVMAGPIQ
jgi:hypothetical protein